MKILQLNIWGGKLEKQLALFLNREDADVVCLQEVVSVEGGRSYFFLDIHEILAKTSYKYFYHTPSWSGKYMRREASWGNCILSKTPFKKQHNFYTYLEEVTDFDFLEDTDHNAGRSLQHVVVETDKGMLNILNHHGHHVHEHKNGDDETLRQCGLIADYAKKLEGQVVLCGDFNLVPDSLSLEQINAVLVNHVKERGILSTRTPLTHKTEACDFIFTSPDIEVKNFQVLDDIVSDHKALTIKF
ncbi:MAG: endonuclease/exonuclease/phosphatase family protein [Candidatus Paceibacterota bacterium]